MGHVVVAGVIGLSVALRLQANGHLVTIVASDFLSPSETIDSKLQIDFTSPWGGAHNRWILPADATEEREHAFVVTTFACMRDLQASNPEAGITFMKGVEYLEAPSETYLALTPEKAKKMGMEDFRLLQTYELPRDVTWGCEYTTWCINPMVYCSFLLRRFKIQQGHLRKQKVRNLAELFHTDETGGVDFAVNCSGHGLGDDKMFIMRGQTCLVTNPCPVTISRQYRDGSWAVIIPRNFDGGTILGGTREPNNWESSPREETRQKILHNCAETYPKILSKDMGFGILGDIVGRRPARFGGMRLEAETLAKGKRVIHAYGLSGRGYELSWGVAEEVATLLSKSIK